MNDHNPDFAKLPAEYLWTFNPAGIPPSKLELQVGCPVILLWNICLTQGLWNGIRMSILQIELKCLKVQILGGEFDGNIKLLPRILLSTTEEELPFILPTKQFPIKLLFAMTVNKSLGQTPGIIGLDL